MRLISLLSSVLASGLAFSWGATLAESPQPSAAQEETLRTFQARGVVKEIHEGERTVIINHEAVANYMDAMTMPFKVKEPKELAGLHAGDEIAFRLSVTDKESWIGQITKVGTVRLEDPKQPVGTGGSEASVPAAKHPLLNYKFSNELGQAVSLNDFRGQALAITFFFTRCPIPDYCPRLSKNFQDASIRLASWRGAPTNWHFLSVSFDTEFDSPAVLKAYGDIYHYDRTHWSFLTGAADKVGELARLSDVKFERDAGSFNHNFRTLIIDAAGHLQTVFPTGGDLSNAIVDEMLKAMAATNRAIALAPNHAQPTLARSQNSIR
jgi:protein SCO1/2